MLLVVRWEVLLLAWSIFLPLHCRRGDYWSEDYDKALNCKNEDQIIMLNQDKDSKKGHCENVEGDLSDTEVFQKCKLRLAKALGTMCSSTTVEKSGDLLYCKNLKLTTCCFINHTCTKNWETIDDAYSKQALDFLKDKEGWLKKEKIKGYESCHPISTNLDASICEKDCQSYKKNSAFSKQCDKEGGFFKCCIRRDKANCHECRFCCTLLMCTKKVGLQETHTVFSSFAADANATVNTTDDGIQQAKELFFATAHSYAAPDYRCLNPSSDKDPSKWGAYDPNELESAVTQESLNQVKTYKFDKRHMNFDDPEVLKQMIGKNLEKNWKETYGVDFAALDDGDSSEVLLNCREAEKSKFAKDCLAKDGFFKCCVTGWNLNKFTVSSKLLKDQKNSSSFDHPCLAGEPEKCHLLTNTHICSSMEPYSGLSTLEFRTPLVNPLGGGTVIDAERTYRIVSNQTDLRLGLRATWCILLDTCAEDTLYYENINNFMFASDRKSFCELAVGDIVNSKEVKKNDTDVKCLTRKDPNIRVCPKKIFEKKEKQKKNGLKLFENAMKKLWMKKKKKSKNTKNKNQKKKKGRKKKIKKKTKENNKKEKKKGKKIKKDKDKKIKKKSKNEDKKKKKDSKKKNKNK